MIEVHVANIANILKPEMFLSKQSYSYIERTAQKRTNENIDSENQYNI